MKKTNDLLKRTMLAACLLAVCWMPARADVLVGDVDGDGKVSIDDVAALIDYLLTWDGTQALPAAADVDGDGDVTIDDLAQLIDVLLLTASQPAEDHEWVDLGLPSGTLWATCNVGADKPEEYGDYFAWGETAPKDYYASSTYKWYQGYYDAYDYYHSGYTKYCTNSSYGLDGFVDNKTELDASDDAAYVNWGPSWRMPTFEQQIELSENCYSVWTTQNGVNGRLVTGPNGNTMFLPAAGSREYAFLIEAGSYGYYWSRTLDSGDPYRAYFLIFGWGYWGRLSVSYRNYGLTVRAVRVS